LVGIRSAEAYAANVLTQYAEIGKRATSFRRCKIIARYGIGADIVDVDEATRRNIVVTNIASDRCMNEVADHAVALLMALVRKLPQYDHANRAGEWKWQTGPPIQRLQEGTVGLFSFGAIAKEVARRMKGFGVTNIIACDPYADKKDAAAEGVPLVSFEELLAKSDYLVIQFAQADLIEAAVDAGFISGGLIRQSKHRSVASSV
jgi:D-3-phosphoglycerate dehydrogenase